MYRPLTSVAPRPRRRGAILIVVLALLALFAVIGLSFVFYSDSEATAARIHREGESGAAVDGGMPDTYYEDAVNRALGALLFDVFDTGNDLLCGLRGHSLGGTKFGRYQQAGGSWFQAFTAAPFTGVGTFHAATPAGPDRAQWPNYSAVFNGNILDPEWTGIRTTAQAGTPPWQVPGQTYIPKNPPYTYPDLNNFFLASLSPADGQVLVPSFHRPWLFNSGNNYQNGVYRLAPWDPTDTNNASPYYKNAAANTDWVTPEGRTKIVRPRPVDQLHPSDFAAAGLPYPIAPGLSNYAGPQQVALFTLISTKINNGEIIPYPPANADGSYTGDIQNLLGGVGVQKNDSILVDLGLPFKVWNGKLIKPMASILITDLDGLLNLNAHGNVRNMTTAAPGISKHVSYAGYGPWEINLGKGFEFNPSMVTISTTPTLPTEADNIVFLRYGSAGAAVTHNPVINTLPYLYDRSGARLPLYGLVNWDANGPIIPPPLLLPTLSPTTPNGFQVSPTFNNVPMSVPPFFDDNTTNIAPNGPKGYNHPALFNPNDWAAINTGSPRVFPLSDLKRLTGRYAADLPWYQQMDLYKTASPPLNSIVGTAAAGPSYRLDPAHPRRMLFTPLSANNDWPGHVGNFNAITTGAALELNTAVYPPMPSYLPPGSYPGPYPPAPNSTIGAISDFGTITFQNQRPVGPVDLNRPLTDYYGTNSNPTPGVAPANYTQAWADRHNLARDLFARLIVATGAVALVDPGTGNVVLPTPTGTGSGSFTLAVGMTTLTITTNEYNALRYLAQVAANMVDAIDNDDLCTPFVWNPPSGVLTQTINPAVDFQTGLTASTANTTPVNDRMVFGVEKPKLTLSEAYAEIANDPLEPTTAGVGPANPAHVRFWVELMNPTNNPYNGSPGTTGPQGTGAAQVRYDPALGDAGVPAAYNPYKIVVARFNKTGGTSNVRQYLQDPSNVLGGLPVGAAADIDYDFTNANVGTAGSRIVMPNNGMYTGAGGVPLTPAQGCVVVGPAMPAPAMGATGPQVFEFNPTNPLMGAAPPPWNQMIQSPSQAAAAAPNPQNAMEYLLATVPSEGTGLTNLNGQDFMQHVVMLRRLANPYFPVNDPTLPTFNPALPANPYITVDFMDYVPAFDAVNRTPANTGTARTPKPGAPPSGPGYDPQGYRFSVGKVQPYAGLSFSNAAYPLGGGTPTTLSRGTYAFPNSCVLGQLPNGFIPATSTVPANTFGRYNGTQATDVYTPGTAQSLPTNPGETIMAPFDWFVHFDRAVANQLELLQLQAGKPHEVTQLYVRPSGASFRKDMGLVPWLGVNSATNQPGYDVANNRTNNGLFRALDLLRVKPWGYGVGLGGRVQGRVNINTAQDMRVLQAVLDAPPPPWANSTLYGVGQLVANNGNIYVCSAVTTGMSAPTGGGPSGTTSPITDAGVTWSYARPGSGNLFNTADVAALWAACIGSRTPAFDTTLHTTASGSPIPGGVPIPGPTLDDLPAGGTDRPFKPFGIGEFTPGGQYGFMAGSGLQDTLLRINPGNGMPLVWSTNPNTLVNGAAHPYLQAEMVRKMMNNVTTTSDAFAVSITVLFHEVRPDPTGNPLTVTEIPGFPRTLLGKEAFKDVPGDLRQQFFAVVDRSNMVLRPGTQFLTTDNVAFGGSAQPPFFTSLEPAGGGPSYPPGTTAVNIAAAPNPTNPALAPVVYVNGQPLAIIPGQTLAIGVGANQEVTSVLNAAYDTVNGTGMVTVTLTAPLGKAHAAGECVSNGVLGTPGPQPTFTMPKSSTDKYSAVVPYVSRVR